MKRIKCSTDDIKAFAEELYLTPNEQGKHAYPLRMIAQKVEQKWNKRIGYSTVARWAKELGWKHLWEQGQVKGVLKTIIKVDGVTNQEQIVEAVAEAKSNAMSMNSQLKQKAFNILMQADLAEKDALMLYLGTAKLEADNDLIDNKTGDPDLSKLSKEELLGIIDKTS